MLKLSFDHVLGERGALFVEIVGLMIIRRGETKSTINGTPNSALPYRRGNILYC